MMEVRKDRRRIDMFGFRKKKKRKGLACCHPRGRACFCLDERAENSFRCCDWLVFFDMVTVVLDESSTYEYNLGTNFPGTYFAFYQPTIVKKPVRRR
jgi:hypothetical protein